MHMNPPLSPQRLLAHTTHHAQPGAHTCAARALASSLACLASAAAFMRSAFICSRPLISPDSCG